MTKTYSNLDPLWQRGKAFLNCELPIIGGAMTWVSEENLVAAISNAGGFGVLASGAMPPHLLTEMIEKTKAKTSWCGANTAPLALSAFSA